MSTAAGARVVTFGELLLRLSPPEQERFFQSDTLRAGFGGAEANVAVALAHLGVRTDYVTRLPANAIGDAALETLRNEGVGTGHILRGPERMGIYFVEPGADLATTRVVYDRAGSAFANCRAGMVDWSAVLAGARWFHGTGITPLLGEGPAEALREAVAVARAQQVPFSIDLNYRPALWREDARQLLDVLLDGADLLIANPHSVRAMLGVDVADDQLDTAEGAQRLAMELGDKCHCARVALTRREVLSPTSQRWSASLCCTATGEIATSRRWTIGVVDRVGGGDAFAGALIAQILRGAPPHAAVEFAVAASALKLRIPGDFNRVTAAEVDELLRGMAVAGVAAADAAERMR